MRAVEPVDDAYPVVSVGRLASYVNRKIGADAKLRRLGVRGEISGLSTQPNGNVYFDLKDRDAILKCVAWSEAAAKLPPLANGQEIIAVGSVTTWAQRSIYQLAVVEIEHGGLGRLHAMYEALKTRLGAEGLFASERKRALPRFPFRVALISSRAANGAGDFLVQAAVRAPHVSIEFFETAVQGASAAPEIVRALDRASRAAVDVVVLARGGGSYEDLFVFSDERVVRALVRCAHPTVSAIGHEADSPLTDFVADHRAATPSTAAQTILPLRTDLHRTLAVATATLDRSLKRTIERAQRDVSRIEIRSPLWAPGRYLMTRRQAIDAASADIGRAFDRRMRSRNASVAALCVRLEKRNPSVQLSQRRERLMLAGYRLSAVARNALAGKRRSLEDARERIEPMVRASHVRRVSKLVLLQAMLDGRDPTRILQRGYAIVSINGSAVRDAATIAPGTLLTAQLARGRLTARVESTTGDGTAKGDG